jgi:hypothetical protein
MTMNAPPCGMASTKCSDGLGAVEEKGASWTVYAGPMIGGEGGRGGED